MNGNPQPRTDYTAVAAHSAGSRAEFDVRVKILIGAVTLGLSLLMGLYGAFAILYGGDGGGDTYVKLAGHRLDADSVGAAALLVAFLGAFAALPFLGARRAFAGIALGLAVPAAVLGAWLLSLGDPEGAAQLIGGVVLAGAGALAFAAALALWRGRL